MVTQVSGDTGVSACQPNSVSQDDLQTGVVGKGPAFRASMSAPQNIATSTVTKITFNTEQFDTNNYYDPTTNFRFTPLVAGYYQISVGLAGPASAAGVFVIQIHKNGVRVAAASLPNTAAVSTFNVDDLVFLNGTTDFVEAFANQTTGGAINVGSADSSLAFFSGCLVRSV